MKISRTPLRFSLIGGGSDLPAYWRNYGPCEIVSMTIVPSMYVTFTERNLYAGFSSKIYGSNIRLSYTQTENVDSIAEIQHELIRETLKALSLVPSAFEMTTIGDIPSRGAGLGSSSALIVGILRLFQKPGRTAGWLASVAAGIEIERLGKNIGWQDHLSAVHGGLRRYKICPEEIKGLVAQESLDVDGQGKELAEWLIAFRLPANRSETTQKAESHETLVAMEREMESRSVFLKHTVELVQPMADAVLKKQWEEVGRVLMEAWELKMSSHGGIDKDIERWYSIGVEAGARAGKVSGSMSKGAGHLFFLVNPDIQHRVREVLSPELAEMVVEYYPFGSKTWEI